MRLGLVVVQVNLFVFDASPESLINDVVQCTAPVVRADLDLALFENFSKGIACETRALIAVKDLWISCMKRSIERAQAKVVLLRRGDHLTEHIARVPINYCDKVNEAGLQSDIFDIRAPYLIHAIYLQPAQQVWINLVTRCRER